MGKTSTRFLRKTLLNPFDHSWDGTLSTSHLIMLGVLVAVIHNTWRWSIGIPGHHGLEWMAVLIFGRMLSGNRWAGSLVAFGAAGTYLMLGQWISLAHQLKPVFGYLMTGISVDIIYGLLLSRLPITFNAILTSTVAFLAKPIILFSSTLLFGFEFGMFSKHGVYLPLASHCMFGFFGGICGALAANATRHIHPRDE